MKIRTFSYRGQRLWQNYLVRFHFYAVTFVIDIQNDITKHCKDIVETINAAI